MSAPLQEIVALVIVLGVAAFASYRWLRGRRLARGASCQGCYGASECGTVTKSSDRVSSPHEKLTSIRLS